ncbi:hypothetical protein E4665_16370 [Sporolactobacillus shoreae]|uniref:Preprotein translocase subunit Tim44 n=1 Tax=Sporolactobacillus shoreae TaxID=1465501 RepID=A0A4Z0GHE8_9BACL|nr:hypothetical protein [Sporolactobacillus shoreae]TGA96173.1 hypothetical protein E4665_16370 [Sporolactobacillus shoreae]
MIKKLMAAFLALALIFSPAGDYVFHQDHQVSAKGYRSGIKSFSPNKGSGFNSPIGSRQQKSYQGFGNSMRGFTSGGFMKGMIFGGLSGLLFGSLLSHFGGFGMMAGFLINILAIIAIIALIRYLFVSIADRSRRRKAEESDQWKR